MRLECDQLSKTYHTVNGGVYALDDVTFHAEESEFLCIVGPSGCGKTTLLKLIANLERPSGGRISFLNGQTEEEPTTALVFQEHALFPWMTVVDNVAFPLETRGVGKKERRRRAREFLTRVGLERCADHLPHELSVGMRQRANIARAFLAEPAVLLMDEPFGSLDAQTKVILQQELLRIWKEHQKLVLYVTHDIREAVLLGDRVLVMSDHPGRVRDMVTVPLGRPREPEDLEKPGAVRTIHRIWEQIEEEVRRASWMSQ
jgi:NitT/TauT family transport system ATP-binding protein